MPERVDSAREARALRTQLTSLPNSPSTNVLPVVALVTQTALTEKAKHRGPRLMDLVIAAVADTIRRVTGQPMEWLAPHVSLD